MESGFSLVMQQNKTIHMNILHISDTHCMHDQFPEKRFEGIDMVIHSGDCSNSPFLESSKREI